MTVHAARAHTRRRTTAALSGLAALALVLGACGEEGTAEDMRAALDRLCTWWQSQEAHLDGTGVAR